MRSIAPAHRPTPAPPCFVMAVLRRGRKLCPAKKTPPRSVKLMVSPNAKQTLSQMNIESAPMRA